MFSEIVMAVKNGDVVSNKTTVKQVVLQGDTLALLLKGGSQGKETDYTNKKRVFLLAV